MAGVYGKSMEKNARATGASIGSSIANLVHASKGAIGTSMMRSSIARDLQKSRALARGRDAHTLRGIEAKSTIAAYQKSRNAARKAAAVSGKGVRHRPAGSPAGGQFY